MPVSSIFQAGDGIFSDVALTNPLHYGIISIELQRKTANERNGEAEMDKTLPERCYAFYCDAVTACRQQDGHRALTDPFLAAAGKLGFLVQEATAHEGTSEALLRLRKAETLRREAAYWIDALEHGRYLKEADSIRLGAACGKIGRLIQAAIHEHTAFEDLAFAPFRKPRIFCQTPRLVLRRFVREDAETLLSFSKDEALCDSGWPSLTSRDEALEAITRWQWDTEYMAVSRRKEEEAIGYVALRKLGEVCRGLQIGLIPSRRGMGYGDEILEARLSYAFRAEYFLEAIAARCFAEATTYRRMLERNGLTLDTTLPHEGKHGGSLLSFSITRQAWHRAKPSLPTDPLPSQEEEDTALTTDERQPTSSSC